ncbi:MAG TPA: phosphatase PAP2 family protein [Acidimicrobiia bacterium]
MSEANTRHEVRELIEQFDAAASRAAERLHSPALDHVAYAIGSACDHSLLWHAIGAVRAARAGDLGPSARLSGALGIESALTNGPVKALFRRVRPRSEPADGATPARLPYGMRVPITSSFPSGHAAAAFCAATILHAETGHKSWYALATVVSATRVYTRMHHASDVVAGAAWGAFLGHAIQNASRATAIRGLPGVFAERGEARRLVSAANKR